MLEFRIVIGIKKRIVSNWLDASKWTVRDMLQFQAFGVYEIEYRGGKN